MAMKILCVIGALVSMVGCQWPGSPATCNTSIDWVDLIQVGSTQYVAGLQQPTVLRESDLGTVFAHVKFKLEGNVCDPNYRLKDGDAARLEPGTPIYQVNGHAPSEELAARFKGNIVLYRVMPPAP